MQTLITSVIIPVLFIFISIASRKLSWWTCIDSYQMIKIRDIIVHKLMSNSRLTPKQIVCHFWPLLWRLLQVLQSQSLTSRLPQFQQTLFQNIDVGGDGKLMMALCLTTANMGGDHNNLPQRLPFLSFTSSHLWNSHKTCIESLYVNKYWHKRSLFKTSPVLKTE